MNEECTNPGCRYCDTRVTLLMRKQTAEHVCQYLGRRSVTLTEEQRTKLFNYGSNAKFKDSQLFDIAEDNQRIYIKPANTMRNHLRWWPTTVVTVKIIPNLFMVNKNAIAH